MKQITEQQYRNNLHYIDFIKKGEEKEDEATYYGYSNHKATPVSMIKRKKLTYKGGHSYIDKFYWEK